MNKYCENWLCDAEAVELQPVGDELRALCACCAEVYELGLAHGLYLTEKKSDNESEDVSK